MSSKLRTVGLLAVGAALALLVAGVVLQVKSCWDDRESNGQVVHGVPEEEVIELARHDRRPRSQLLTQRNEVVTGRGEARDPAIERYAIEYAAALMSVPESGDSGGFGARQASPLYPPFNVQTEKERGVKVGVVRSDSVYEVVDFGDCKHPCSVWGRGNSADAHGARDLKLFNPLKDAAHCAIVAGAGYGVAKIVEQAGDDPLPVPPAGVAGIAGGGCVVAKIVF
jgi:hypothetical protein